jgi:hypothetical protein
VHPDDGRDGQAEGRRVDRGVVTGDDTGLLQAGDPLGHARAGHPDRPAQLGVRRSRIGPQGLDQRLVDGIHAVILPPSSLPPVAGRDSPPNPGTGALK